MSKNFQEVDHPPEQEPKQRINQHEYHGIKRYNLAIPYYMYDEIKTIADSNDTTILDVIKKFLKLGLTISREQRKQNCEVIIRTDSGIEKEILIL